MNRSNTIFNVIIAIAVIVLYILHFTSKNKNEVLPKTLKPSRIAYVDSDSLWNKYDMVKTLKQQLEEKKNKLEANIQYKVKAFENEVNAYKNKLATGQIKPEQAKVIEQQLMLKQQSLYQLKDSLSVQFAREQTKLNDLLQDSIVNYLKRYNKKTRYDFILAHSKGSGVLYANDSLQITDKILEGLNKEYKKQKK
ncbi:MAG: OmpH family outer membrane protein [Bacteroidota bacterium]|nr:OmpH family outer membrane protein [Bacteroidota bacterium]